MSKLAQEKAGSEQHPNMHNDKGTSQEENARTGDRSEETNLTSSILQESVTVASCAKSKLTFQPPGRLVYQSNKTLKNEDETWKNDLPTKDSYLAEAEEDEDGGPRLGVDDVAVAARGGDLHAVHQAVLQPEPAQVQKHLQHAPAPARRLQQLLEKGKRKWCQLFEFV